MTIWYIDPTAAAASDSFVGPFGVGNLRQSWEAISWVTNDSYYQRSGTTVVLTANLTPSGNGITIGAYGEGPPPIILSDGAITVIYGMFFSAGSNVSVSDLHFKMVNRQSGYAGMRIGGTTNFSLRNCVIEGFDVGIFVTATAVNTTIEGNEIFDIGDDGLLVGATNGGRIVNNSIYRTSQRVNTGDNIQFLDAVDWGAWEVTRNRLSIEISLKQCVMIGVPASATQVPVRVELNICRTTCNGIQARHAAIVRGNDITISGNNTALIANAGLSNQPIVFSGNVVRCVGDRKDIDPGSGIIGMAVYADAGAGITHTVSFYNNTVIGDVYRGFFAGATIDLGVIVLRNNLLAQTLGNLSLGFSVVTGATATFTESNTAIFGFTSQQVNLPLTSPITIDPRPYLNSDMSLFVPFGTTKATMNSNNPLALVGTYVQGVRLYNGRMLPGWCPVGAYQAVLPKVQET